jgi:MFS family permease
VTGTTEAPGERRWARVTASWRSGPLGVPAFRLLTAGQFTSNIGDYCYAIALPWLVLSDHGDAAQLGVVLACYGIPRAALISSAGWIADRLGARPVMLAADAARCVLTVLFALFAAAHVSSLAALAPVAAVLGACSALFLPASYSIMPSLLDGKLLASANGIYQGVVQTSSLIGPAIGGAIVATAGPTAAFGVDAASYLLSAVSLAMIRTAHSPPPAAPPGPSGETGRAPASVWRLLLGSRGFQVVIGVSLAANLALVATTEVALPDLTHARYGAGGYGAVLTCVAVGGILGTVIVTRMRGLSRPLVAIGITSGAAGVAIGLAPFLGGLPGLAAGMFVFGVSTGFDGVLAVTVIQRWAPDGMLGRVMGLLMIATAASFPVSTVLAGLLARHLGPTAVFPISGALLAAAMLAGLTQRQWRNFGDEPA